ncbi:ABC transporter permease [Bacillus fonticola]|uniref:ABC transporter permease n=1 Tax=Bacillus fonticola TaxID=2728853 RepID=UPI001476632D|nr:ABC transporter permease [Bacillus fonticola]
MNIVNKLTVRSLKQNKRRTLITIIGVIISVAMVTAVVTLGVSFMDLMKRQTIANSGEWHVLYEDVNKDQLTAIQNDEATKSVILSRDVGYATLEGGQNRNKPYLFIKEYNAEGFEKFPIKLSEGRLPQATDEVVISEAILTNAKVDLAIGETLTLEVGDRTTTNEEPEEPFGQNYPLYQNEKGEMIETLTNLETKNYTVVGLIKRPTWEPTWAPGYTILSYVDESMLGIGEQVQASVVLEDVKSTLFTHAERFAAEQQIEKFSFHDELLRYYGVIEDGGFRTTLFSLLAVIMGVIMVGSISLIYNAFAISVSERSRHLGMLASVGATRRQKKHSVLFEGLVIGLISIPIGMVSGLIGIGITFFFINSTIKGALGITEGLTVSVSPFSIFVASAVSLLTIFISAYLPAKRASKISAIDAIRQTADVKLTERTVKTSKLVRKLFGMEAEIGLKNLKRNKRKYQATVFSLVISIVLFLSVSFFTDSLKKSLELSQDGVNYDISASVYTGGSIAGTNQLANLINSLDDVTQSNAVTSFHNATSWVSKELLTGELREMVEVDESMLEDDKYRISISIHALDDDNLQAYAEKVGASFDQLNNLDDLKAIVVDTTTLKDVEAKKFVEAKVIETETGESLEMNSIDWETEEEQFLGSVEIAALTDQLPMGITPSGIGRLNIIVSQQALDQIIGNKPTHGIESSIFFNSTDPISTQQEIQDMVITIGENQLNVYNVYQVKQQEQQMILLMSVFTYGFIVLITAISIANIFNTISTSISLRKREFAMLKSVGMTPKGFNKMINYESIFYGVRSLLYGLPISIGVMYLTHRALSGTFSYEFTLPVMSMGYAVAAVFMIVGAAMLYSSAKVKKENIIDALKQENL